MKKSIRVENLSKNYGGFKALSNINFSVDKGTIHGLLGENGAGKTTAMRCLLGLSYSDSGNMFIEEIEVSKNNFKLRKNVSYLAGDFRPYENIKPIEYFKYILKLENNSSEKYYELAERFKLNLNKKIKELSKGNKQKVGIVQAFMRESNLLILDEPTSGLDPNYQRVFRELINEEKELGNTILLSSHDLLEISNCCDFITVIKEGKVISSQSKRDLIEKTIKKVSINFLSKPSESEINKIKCINNFEVEENEIKFYISGDINEFIKFISNFSIKEIETESSNLSETLLEYF
ncbi:MAG: ATP-binding cassette domain-containing protein [Dehalococcoidales bacterium]|nr:ATP-binding cassette domain-containing protein [Dehalococcoidales bacterium]